MPYDQTVRTIPSAIDRSQCPAGPDGPHGTASAYTRARCRCPDARNAWRLYKKRGREGRRPPGYVSVMGVRRRLQALASIGYTITDISTLSSVPFPTVRDLIHPWIRGGVSARLDRQFRALYARLSGTPGPSHRAALRARAKGWAPPLAWNDIDDPDEKPVRAKYRTADGQRPWSGPGEWLAS